MKYILIFFMLIPSLLFSRDCTKINTKAYQIQQKQMNNLFRNYLNDNIIYRDWLKNYEDEFNGLKFIFIPNYFLKGDFKSVKSVSDLLNCINFDDEVLVFDVYAVDEKTNCIIYWFDEVPYSNSIISYIDMNYMNESKFKNEEIIYLDSNSFKLFPFHETWVCIKSEIYILKIDKNKLIYITPTEYFKSDYFSNDGSLEVFSRYFNIYQKIIEELE